MTYRSGQGTDMTDLCPCHPAPRVIRDLQHRTLQCGWQSWEDSIARARTEKTDSSSPGLGTLQLTRLLGASGSLRGNWGGWNFTVYKESRRPGTLQFSRASEAVSSQFQEPRALATGRKGRLSGSLAFPHYVGS
jgi:hypothetical protein